MLTHKPLIVLCLLLAAASAHPVHHAELTALTAVAHGHRSPFSAAAARARSRVAAIPRAAARALRKRYRALVDLARPASGTAALQSVFARSLLVKLAMPQEPRRAQVLSASLAADGRTMFVQFADGKGEATLVDSVELAGRGNPKQPVSVSVSAPSTPADVPNDEDDREVVAGTARQSMFLQWLHRGGATTLPVTQTVTLLVPLATAAADDALGACWNVVMANADLARCFSRVASRFCVRIPQSTCALEGNAEACWRSTIHHCLATQEVPGSDSRAGPGLLSMMSALAWALFIVIVSAVIVVMLGLLLCSLSLAWKTAMGLVVSASAAVRHGLASVDGKARPRPSPYAAAALDVTLVEMYSCTK